MLNIQINLKLLIIEIPLRIGKSIILQCVKYRVYCVL